MRQSTTASMQADHAHSKRQGGAFNQQQALQMPRQTLSPSQSFHLRSQQQQHLISQTHFANDYHRYQLKELYQSGSNSLYPNPYESPRLRQAAQLGPNNSRYLAQNVHRSEMHQEQQQPQRASQTFNVNGNMHAQNRDLLYNISRKANPQLQSFQRTHQHSQQRIDSAEYKEDSNEMDDDQYMNSYSEGQVSMFLNKDNNMRIGYNFSPCYSPSIHIQQNEFLIKSQRRASADRSSKKSLIHLSAEQHPSLQASRSRSQQKQQKKEDCVQEEASSEKGQQHLKAVQKFSVELSQQVQQRNINNNNNNYSQNNRFLSKTMGEQIKDKEAHSRRMKEDQEIEKEEECSFVEESKPTKKCESCCMNSNKVIGRSSSNCSSDKGERLQKLLEMNQVKIQEESNKLSEEELLLIPSFGKKDSSIFATFLTKGYNYFRSFIEQQKVQDRIDFTNDNAAAQEGDGSSRKRDLINVDSIDDDVIVEMDGTKEDSLVDKDKKSSMIAFDGISELQTKLSEEIHSNIVMIDELNAEICGELNASFESIDSAAADDAFLDGGGASDKTYLLDRFCTSVEESERLRTSFMIHAQSEENPSISKVLIQLNRSIGLIKAKQSAQDTAIFSLMKMMKQTAMSERDPTGGDAEAAQDIDEEFEEKWARAAAGLESMSSKEFSCKFCSKIFTKSCSLGGHISRVHKGRSDQYKEKQKIRQKREMERLRKTHFKRKGDFIDIEERTAYVGGVRGKAVGDHSACTTSEDRLKKRVKMEIEEGDGVIFEKSAVKISKEEKQQKKSRKQYTKKQNRENSMDSLHHRNQEEDEDKDDDDDEDYEVKTRKTERQDVLEQTVSAIHRRTRQESRITTEKLEKEGRAADFKSNSSKLKKVLFHVKKPISKLKKQPQKISKLQGKTCEIDSREEEEEEEEHEIFDSAEQQS